MKFLKNQPNQSVTTSDFYSFYAKIFLKNDVIFKKKYSLPKERLSHSSGIGLSSGSPAYSAHTASSTGRSSGLSSSQHNHGPSMHQPADFQPPYFPPPFHHPSTHQSPPQQQQQVSKNYQISIIKFIIFLIKLESSWT